MGRGGAPFACGRRAGRGSTRAKGARIPGSRLTETAFSPATLSPGELDKLNYTCGFIQGSNGSNGQGSGAGICKSCRIGGLGAAAVQ